MEARRPFALAMVGGLAWGLAVAAAAVEGDREGRAADAGGRARDARLVQWADRAFDPLHVLPSAPSALPELDALATTAPRGSVPDEVVRLVQAGDAGPAALRDALAAAGMTPVGFVPNAAYLVRLPASWLPKLRALPGVRFEGDYRPAWKAGDAVAASVRDDDAAAATAPPTRLAVAFLAGTSADLYRDVLESLPGSKLLALETDEAQPRAVVEVAPRALRRAVTAIAAWRDVLRVELHPVPRPLLDDATWYVQGGNDAVGASDYDVSAPLFARGITGRGVLLGLIDDGLENDHCQFVYEGATDEAAWPIGPSADAPGAVPDEERLRGAGPAPVRTRERRVVAYYVQSGAAPYAPGMQHGTTVAEAILGDDPSVLAARPLVRDIGDGQNVFPFDPAGDWLVGEELRPDLASRVDDPRTDDPSFPNAYGSRVEHHQLHDGIAPGAQLVLQDIGDAEGVLASPVSLARMLSQARRTGATVVTTAFGSDSCTSCYGASASDVDQATWRMRDLVVVGAAGNDGDLGPGTIGGGIAHAKNAIIVGATAAPASPSAGTARLGEDVMSFSALGPATGGRLAPEIMAPGVVRVRAGHSNPVVPEDGSGSGDFACGAATPDTVGGTSFSSAVAGGMAALVQQYFLDGYYPGGSATPQNALRPTNALVRAVLVNSARDLGGARTDDAHSGSAHRPSFGQGWGAPRLDDTLYFAGETRGPGSTQRARLLVLNDVPNGFDGAFPFVPEPGGRTRDAIVANFRPSIANLAIHEFYINLENPDPGDAANELRFTLAWSDPPGMSDTAPQVNDLDLEIVSPGPDGVLQTRSGLLAGDDVVYRPHPQVAWSGGFTRPSAVQAVSPTRSPGSLVVPDRDTVNTVENVFVPTDEARSGVWLVRVIGARVAGTGGAADAMPNVALNDTPPVFDTDGDGVADLDARDIARADVQGYALIVSGSIVIEPPPFTPRVPRTPRGPRPPRETPGPRR